MKINNKFSLLHRLLHWIMAMAMSVLFITGFLRMYWMNKHHIVSIIENKTDLITNETMNAIAKTIREPMWQWHEVFANIMVIAFIVRIIYMLVKGIRFPNPFRNNLSIKERLQGFTYIYFYVFVFISAVTGIFIEKEFFIEWKDGIETVHKWGIYWFPIFIILHFAGIVIMEYSTQKGSTSKMIGGE